MLFFNQNRNHDLDKEAQWGSKTFMKSYLYFKKGRFQLIGPIYTVFQINLLHCKIFWSTGFPEFQPIKMYSTLKCIVISQKSGKPVALQLT